MNRPLISIIIPVYNAAATLSFCIESIINQTFKNVEMVIMDGLSTDGTAALVQSYAAKHSNISWRSAKDAGIYDAMNKGISVANGGWLYFMGSDDTLFDSNVLREISGYLNDDADIIYGNTLWMPDNRQEEGGWNHKQLLNMSINHQRIFYRSNLFTKSGAFNLMYKIAADYELNIRLFCDPGVKKKYINVTIARYHSGGYSANKVDEAFWDDWKNILLKNFSPYLPKKVIYNRVSWYCWYNMQQKKYGKALQLFCTIYFNVFNFSFLKHSVSQFIKSSGTTNPENQPH